MLTMLSSAIFVLYLWADFYKWDHRSWRLGGTTQKANISYIFTQLSSFGTSLLEPKELGDKPNESITVPKIPTLNNPMRNAVPSSPANLKVYVKSKTSIKLRHRGAEKEEVTIHILLKRPAYAPYQNKILIKKIILWWWIVIDCEGKGKTSNTFDKARSET